MFHHPPPRQAACGPPSQPPPVASTWESERPRHGCDFHGIYGGLTQGKFWEYMGILELYGFYGKFMGFNIMEFIYGFYGNMMGIYGKIWRFPKLGAPPNHPFLDGIFHEINHHFWGTPIYGNPHMEV